MAEVPPVETNAATDPPIPSDDKTVVVDKMSGLEIRIGPALERALFVKFWKWCAVVAGLAIPIIGFVAVFAVQTVQLAFKTDADKLNIYLLETVAKGITTLSKYEADAKATLGKVSENAEKTSLSASKSNKTAEEAADLALKTQEKIDQTVLEVKEAAKIALKNANESKTSAITANESLKTLPSVALLGDIKTAANALKDSSVFQDVLLVKTVAAVKLEAISGEKSFALKHASDANWEANGRCPEDTILVNFYCQIDAGGGTLQNLGVGDGIFRCVWNNAPATFRGWGQPVCLRIVSKK